MAELGDARSTTPGEADEEGLGPDAGGDRLSASEKDAVANGLSPSRIEDSDEDSIGSFGAGAGADLPATRQSESSLTRLKTTAASKYFAPSPERKSLEREEDNGRTPCTTTTTSTTAMTALNE
ncbi:Hypothetical Protein FCC1311_084902 [Hondaea fermentalgiana]|uniref:Uncharacterized protein n=1 Tax=Hondaea fermentalgiana TaxID=2315210 RepID=A0A2R5GNR8_9STRA|nr:Hypothetical Protein FCC1311_084902 [Hondaea fermentalgiana]|eukprot:GBG32265.1 Hypothetical Protein FCC1311_084902 [Hondaea fermentalgiana]